MQNVLLIVLLLVTVAMVVVILLQKSEGGALGMGGGGSGLGGLFSPRGAGDALSRTTAILAVIFFVASLALTMLAVHGRPEKSFLDSSPLGTAHSVSLPKPAPASPGPQGPSVPKPH
ncbi:MAG: preprotein translocase subunit SecG [Rhizomicrobium sp.]|jgi:preprotein translocase subunit SecG